MWPASMLAKRRTESETIRMRFDMTSSRKMKAAMKPCDPGRDQALEVAERALGADALGRVGDEHDDREHERHRDVRGRRVDRERRDLEAEHVNVWWPVGSGMNPIRLLNQMKRNSVPMNGNHFAAILSSMFPRVMLSRIRP